MKACLAIKANYDSDVVAVARGKEASLSAIIIILVVVASLSSRGSYLH
jgi:hypothetical protein